MCASYENDMKEHENKMKTMLIQEARQPLNCRAS